jgi:hypothetical protein
VIFGNTKVTFFIWVAMDSNAGAPLQGGAI